MSTDEPIDARLLGDVQQAEGLRLRAYQDTRGFWTAGYGHKLNPHISWEGHVISQDQADEWLQADLESARAHAVLLPEWVWLETDCRQNALVELIFNMGPTKWFGFDVTRRMLRLQRWKDAHDALLNSAWAREVQPHGFDEPGRATRLAGYFLMGEYPLEKAA